MKVVAIVSGGLDSTVLYWWLIDRGDDVLPVHFTYGGKHNPQETEALRTLIPYAWGVHVPIPTGKSSLMDKDIKIPKGHYQDESMRSTVVPFRNGILLAHAVAIAEAQERKEVYYGAHAGDHPIYPDCRGPFVRAFEKAAYEGTYTKVSVIAPFLEMDKSDIAEIAKNLGREVEACKTWSCYEPFIREERPIHCGKCGACVERREAFTKAGIADTTEYAE